MTAARTQTALERADVSRLLFLDTTPARLLVVLFVVSNAVFTVATAHVLAYPRAAYVAMLVVSATAVLLVRTHPDPFPARDTAVVLTAVALSSAMMAYALPDEGDLGRATWHLGSNTWLLFFLAVRRRAWFAWLGMALMAAITAAWGASAGRGALTGITMLDTHIGILLVGTLFALILRRTSARINALNERSVSSAADAAATDAARQVRRARVSELAEVAVPLLEQIAAGTDADDRMRREFSLTEALLRDSVRGRSLAVPAVVDAATQARRRGVEVTILDDRGSAPSDGETLSRMVDATVAGLTRARGGRVTVRLLPEGRPAALTIVAADGDDVERVTLAEDGSPTE
ncbi:hypothetical protein [Demequina muriae]|uniref:Signal transduction histidine kinase n=1 Tax=Demequina muriae TaxID=3051664 RepID=A0ABT8GG40_9MICO|nr:hypothetical protein [Demequina sp. EGI L300058]MDN4480403.1 hypothetical protein [Demequina sp. EGI L300058]